MQEEVEDMETTFDEKMLQKYSGQLNASGYSVSHRLGFGNPKDVIPAIVAEEKCDMLVMGAHGHSFLKDLFLGTTVESVRHKVKVPVLIVRNVN